jgi:NADH:ubiquinone oxidoreductase subunit 4 (subunit M)
VPIVAALAVLATGGDRNAPLQRWLALAGALAGLAVTLPLYAGFDTGTAAMQFEERTAWIEAFNIHYHLGVDGISMLFVILNAFITVLVVIAGWSVIESRVGQYYAAFLMLSGADERRVLGARRGAVLRVLRGDADPDVHHHRRLGRAEPRLRGGQVLPLHAGSDRC